MRLLKKLHKWIGLLIGVQVLLWLLSGLTISLLDPEKVSGRQWSSGNTIDIQAPETDSLAEPAELPPVLFKDALAIDLIARHGKPVYRVKRTGGVTLVDAKNASIITIGKTDAEQLARQDFSGDGEVVSIQSGMAPDMETRGSKGAYWRVDFSDNASTSVYISASTGEVLERRNSYWRVRDFFWMLHIMDYGGRENFNNPLIITVALVAIWLGISGFLMLFGSFSRTDFSFFNVFGKHDDVIISLVDPASGKPRQVRLRKGSNLFLSLATHDVNLPSICGGGGECGKCKVQFETADVPEPNDIELGLIPRRMRERGYRLACQQKANKDMVLKVPGGTLAPGQ
jgi:ferredoxin